ncbi:VOC family protein [Nocardia terpenica]|uniref:VOC family protein n=1 Tax=Nocardia terpenica TaxID=455432 RepID=UPI001892E023|nr:VOC family protein [Nocardia terpenica]MBF6064448.1 VOC family protein [Nocardia terpenica]MBF6106928.1 VOC family protein [Nocardia terpenica]MBF6114416.1 VOC family protein [Nocardia terpenica]MBF6121498.1 VOC family protein [Nocardia terpenica]MBF6153913.1 VOC family protein [Nocardia terpenica]
MSVQLNHTIVHCRDNRKSAEFLADILGLTAGEQWGPFVPVVLANEVTLDFATVGPEVAEITPQHYAFLVTEDEFDAAFARIQDRGLPFWADPQRQRPGEINHNDRGRGVYFPDPDGHYLELLTIPYGG